MAIETYTNIAERERETKFPATNFDLNLGNQVVPGPKMAEEKKTPAWFREFQAAISVARGNVRSVEADITSTDEQTKQLWADGDTSGAEEFHRLMSERKSLVNERRTLSTRIVNLRIEFRNERRFRGMESFDPSVTDTAKNPNRNFRINKKESEAHMERMAKKKKVQERLPNTQSQFDMSGSIDFADSSTQNGKEQPYLNFNDLAQLVLVPVDSHGNLIPDSIPSNRKTNGAETSHSLLPTH